MLGSILYLMAKHQSLDKRTEELRRQLFGKEVTVSKTGFKITSNQDQTRSTNTSYSYHTAKLEESTFLTHDLLKIVTMASFAIGIQLLIYWALNNHLITLPSIG